MADSEKKESFQETLSFARITQLCCRNNGTPLLRGYIIQNALRKNSGLLLKELPNREFSAYNIDTEESIFTVTNLLDSPGSNIVKLSNKNGESFVIGQIDGEHCIKTLNPDQELYNIDAEGIGDVHHYTARHSHDASRRCIVTRDETTDTIMVHLKDCETIEQKILVLSFAMTISDLYFKKAKEDLPTVSHDTIGDMRELLVSSDYKHME